MAKPNAVASVAGMATVAIFAFQKAALNLTGHKPVVTVVTDAQDS